MGHLVEFRLVCQMQPSHWVEINFKFCYRFIVQISTSTATALLLIFVDCVKELPATMLLRPFNFETLATRVHVQASLEDLPNAAPGSILIVLISLCAVFLLARTNE